MLSGINHRRRTEAAGVHFSVVSRAARLAEAGSSDGHQGCKAEKVGLCRVARAEPQSRQRKSL